MPVKIGLDICEREDLDVLIGKWPLLRMLLVHVDPDADILPPANTRPSKEQDKEYVDLLYSRAVVLRDNRPVALRPFVGNVYVAFCNKCGLVSIYADEVKETFGYVNKRGVYIPQSWCRACRNNAAHKSSEKKAMTRAKREQEKARKEKYNGPTL